MRRFRFRLERLARLRALEERVARASWGTAERGARDAEAAADVVRTTLADGRAALGLKLARGPLDPRNVLVEHHVLAVLGRELTRRRQESLTRRGQAERLAEAWRERRAKREALERLRLRARQDHVREAARREAAELDDRSLTRLRQGARQGTRQGERLPAPAPPGPEPI